MRKMKLVILALLLISVALQAQKNPHKNVVIGTSRAPNEPTIAIHPKKPNILLGGSNIYNLYRSKNGGRSWKEETLTSSYGVWGDPVIVADTAGNFYFFHLSNPEGGNWIDRIVCQKSEDNGETWTDGTYMGLNGTKAQDKHWAVVDPRTNYIYVTWTQFDKYGSKKKEDKSSIMFSMSKDEAKTWSAAKKINEVDGDCIDSDNTTEGAVPTIGPNGELYVAWAGPKGLVFDRSLDGGETWMEQDLLIDEMPSGWDYAVPGIYRCNGLPITACDISGGEHNGTIYINWTDQRNGADDTDIWLVSSKDKGLTWTEPVRVNNDGKGNQQFFTWMTIDQTNGYLYFVFYDRRGLKEAETNVYMARSTDGGKTFVNFKINDEPFYPNEGIFFGDYNNIVAQGNIVRPIWTRLDGIQLSIKTALINVAQIPKTASKPIKEEEATDPIVINEESPNADILYVSFKIPKAAKLSLVLYNKEGKKLKTLLKCKKFDYGKHIEEFKIPSLKLEKGIYKYQLKNKCKVIKEREFEVK